MMITSAKMRNFAKVSVLRRSSSGKHRASAVTGVQILRVYMIMHQLPRKYMHGMSIAGVMLHIKPSENHRMYGARHRGHRLRMK